MRRWHSWLAHQTFITEKNCLNSTLSLRVVMRGSIPLLGAIWGSWVRIPDDAQEVFMIFVGIPSWRNW